MKRFVLLTALALVGISQAQYRDSRPVRGAWLRPPSTIALLEVELQNLSSSGISDLYLETFYWGLSTGKQGVFNRRFTFDYLDQATILAARYGIRMHAWVESGYWQYQSTGAYNFTANPEWRVINTATGLPGGDVADQVFANLCHPGVQAKLKSYCTELAQYPGLWSIQTDYHRFPLDNDSADNYPAPWSYDTYSNDAFKAIYGPAADITTTARRTSHSNWNRFLTWRRDGITEAANQMRQGVLAGSNDVLFSGAIFAKAMEISSQLTKCQNWPAMAAAGYLDQVCPMAYYSNVSQITDDVSFAIPKAAGKPVIPGLALTGTAPKPPLADQLNAIKNLGIEEYIIWEANAFDDPVNRTANATWVANVATPLRADFDANGTIDARDWNLFANVYDGVPEPGTGRMDMDSNGTINQIDSQRVREAIRKFRFGPNGIVDTKDQTAFNSALSGSNGSNSAKSLFNLDGDTDVDNADRDLMNFFGSTSPQIFVDVALQNSNLSEDQTFTVELRNASNTVLSTVTKKAKTNGQVILAAPSAGSFRVSVKFGSWLRRTVGITVSASDVVANLSLINGDVDLDGEIGPGDFEAVVDAFGNPGPNPADLDRDGEVGPSDFEIIVNGFGESGDL